MTFFSSSDNAIDCRCYCFPVLNGENITPRYYIHLSIPQNDIRYIQAYAKHNFLSLTSKQQEVLALIIDGIDRNQICEVLNISPRTLEKHTHQILKIAEVDNSIMLLNSIIS